MSEQIEAPPALNDDEKHYIHSHPASYLLKALLCECNKDYIYWSKFKYKYKYKSLDKEDLTPRLLWGYLKEQRKAEGQIIDLHPRYKLHLFVTPQMQEQLNVLDQFLKNEGFIASVIPEKYKPGYLQRVQRAEAYSSSKIEGATTSRDKAEKILRNDILGGDRSQRMIYNNYVTMSLLLAECNADMTEDLLLQIHLSMVRGTLKHTADEGRFRTVEDEVYVEHQLTHEVVHMPPSATELSGFMSFFLALCNDWGRLAHIHPILKGIIIHFLMGYMHPFVDGNGRTARALFYWYMLRSGYSLLKYLSISQKIYESKSKYEKAYLQVEADGFDLGYFIQYHLDVLRSSIEDFKSNVQKKLKEQEPITSIQHIKDFNDRQINILYLFKESNSFELTEREVVQRFGVTLATAKSDLKGLVERGFLDEIAYNKVKRGYLKSSRFDELLEEGLSG